MDGALQGKEKEGRVRFMQQHGLSIQRWDCVRTARQIVHAPPATSAATPPSTAPFAVNISSSIPSMPRASSLSSTPDTVTGPHASSTPAPGSLAMPTATAVATSFSAAPPLLSTPSPGSPYPSASPTVPTPRPPSPPPSASACASTGSLPGDVRGRLAGLGVPSLMGSSEDASSPSSLPTPSCRWCEEWVSVTGSASRTAADLQRDRERKWVGADA